LLLGRSWFVDVVSSPIRIVIADQHPIVRYGLRRLLEESRDFTVVGQASEGEEAVAATHKLNPNVLLLDSAIRRFNALEVLQRIAHFQLRVHTILLMSSPKKTQIADAVHFGAKGIFWKTTGTELLPKSIRCVSSGQFWIDRSLVTDLCDSAQLARCERFGLTRRELEIVSGIAHGGSNKDIAKRFSISVKTVKRHLVNIFDKVGVSSRLELAVFAMHHRIDLGSSPLALAIGGLALDCIAPDSSLNLWV
jgi:two-component system nitrate/nitrite response regulator NarL